MAAIITNTGIIAVHYGDTDIEPYKSRHTPLPRPLHPTAVTNSISKQRAAIGSIDTYFLSGSNLPPDR